MLCAEALPPGKVRIASLPFKDANKCLMEGQAKQLLTAIYEARTYQPDGILHARDVSNSPTVGQEVWTFPWPCLTTGFLGQRSGEITLWASGTGSGKSTVMREIALHHLIRGRPVGMLMLEESPRETLDDLIALHLGKPVRQIKASRELNEVLVAEGEDTLDFGFADDLTDEQYDEAREFISSLPLYIYDHAGTNKFDNLIQRVEYMAVSLGCKVIIIDHVTAVIAGMDRNGSEREAIDEMMKTLRSLVERTGVHLDIVSQLNRLEGKGAEEGGQISLKNLRGSGSLGSVPNNVIAIERNQQSEDPKERNIMKVRSLKGRFTGTTGIAGYLRFNHTTRRIEQATWTERTEDDNAGSTFKSHDRPECTEVQAEEALDGLLDEEPVAQDRALEAHVG